VLIKKVIKKKKKLIDSTASLMLFLCRNDFLSFSNSIFFYRYSQCFDLERESGIVARGIGTAVSLIKLHDSALNHSTTDHPE